MGIFDGYLFCSDMDGTMTIDGELSEENAQAIREFQQEGGIFVVSTGRPPQYVRHFAPGYVPNGPVIATNGAVIYDIESDEAVWETSLDDAALEVMEYVVKNYPYLMDIHITYSMDESSARYLGGCGIPVKEFMGKIPKPWYKIIYCVPAQYSMEVREKLETLFGDRWNFNRSWPEGIEMIPYLSGKGFCIDRLREILGDRARVVVAVGDYENDISMLEHADIAYAVGNAIDSVKAAADRITVPNTEHAIRTIIEELRSECNKFKTYK